MSTSPSRPTHLVVLSLTHPTGKQARERHARGSHETESEGLCRQVRAGEMARCCIETLRPDRAAHLSRNGQEDVGGGLSSRFLKGDIPHQKGELLESDYWNRLGFISYGTEDRKDT
jgi:hypothetical protein